MINDVRAKIGGAVLIAIVSVLGGPQARAATIRYACDGRQNLVIEREGPRATVKFIDRSYDLTRRASSIGEKYESPTAALIIDGKSAVFVADDRLQLGNCSEALLLSAGKD